MTEEKIYPVTDGLEVKITIEKNPFGIYPNALFQMAARINKKRSFLFVSPVLGKHLPVNPGISLMIGRALALIYGEQIEGQEQRIRDVLNCPEKQANFNFDDEQFPLLQLNRPVTVIGFCETATALGHAFFESFASPAKYIHTTREEIDGADVVLSFEEEHSHATAHRVYAQDPKFFEDDSEIILVDDEVTTGKTNLNIIRDIIRAYPQKRKFTIVSILDWRNEENQQAYSDLEQELAVEIREVSLLKGQVEEIGKPNNLIEGSLAADETEAFLEERILVDCVERFSNEKRVRLNEEEKKSAPYLQETGRFGLTEVESGIKMAKTIGTRLQELRQEGSCLVLGTGEFMYLPMRIASCMGEKVFFHTTTRSPILSREQDDYPIFNKRQFPSAEQPGAVNYVYGIPNKEEYQDIFVIFERVVSEENLQKLNNLLCSVDGVTLYFINLAENKLEQSVKVKGRKK